MSSLTCSAPRQSYRYCNLIPSFGESREAFSASFHHAQNGFHATLQLEICSSCASLQHGRLIILLPTSDINRQITWAVSTCERTRRTRTFGIPCSSKLPYSDYNICSSFLFEAQLFVRAFHLKKFSCSFKGYALFFFYLNGKTVLPSFERKDSLLSSQGEEIGRAHV